MRLSTLFLSAITVLIIGQSAGVAIGQSEHTPVTEAGPTSATAEVEPVGDRFLGEAAPGGIAAIGGPVVGGGGKGDGGPDRQNGAART